MKTSPSDWVQWDQKEVLPFDGGISFLIRTSKPCIVKNEFGLILGFGTGQQEVAVTGKGEITFTCTGDIWLRPSSRVQERLEKSTEIFTSLDRPAPMSPEMLAISKMMRKNELERIRDRQEMEKRFAHRQHEADRREPPSAASKAPTDEKKEVGADTPASDDNATKQDQPPKSADAAANGVPEPTASGD